MYVVKQCIIKPFFSCCKLPIMVIAAVRVQAKKLPHMFAPIFKAAQVQTLSKLLFQIIVLSKVVFCQPLQISQSFRLLNYFSVLTLFYTQSGLEISRTKLFLAISTFLNTLVPRFVILVPYLLQKNEFNHKVVKYAILII